MNRSIENLLRLAGATAVLATLAGCYSSETPLFDSGVAVNIVGDVSCKIASGGTVDYAISKATDGTTAYEATDKSTNSSARLVFVRSANPFVYVLQSSDKNNVNYLSFNVFAGTLRDAATDKISPVVERIAKRHNVDVSGGSYGVIGLKGEADDQRAFLKAVADAGTKPLLTCKRS
ncbi:MAG: hypothetical protein ABL866_09930 [Devosia sp.]